MGNLKSYNVKYNFTPCQIKALVNKHFPEADITSVKASNGGMTYNKVYRIDGSICSQKSVYLKMGPAVGVEVPVHEQGTLQTEVSVYQSLKDTSIPIPELYAFDFTKEDVLCDYFIMERIEGKSWLDYWPIKKERPELMRQYGRYIATLHNVHGKRFGYIDNTHFESWSDSFTNMMFEILDEGKKRGYKLPYDQIYNLVNVSRELLDNVKIPQLVNFDMWAGNVFIRKKEKLEISGLIDFERCFYGDPFASFATSFLIFDDIEKEEAFISGYNEISISTLKIREEDRLRMNLYSLYAHILALVETDRQPWYFSLPAKLYLQFEIVRKVKKIRAYGKHQSLNDLTM